MQYGKGHLSGMQYGKGRMLSAGWKRCRHFRVPGNITNDLRGCIVVKIIEDSYIV